MAKQAQEEQVNNKIQFYPEPNIIILSPSGLDSIL